jgi:uncharacterized membrane protein YfbV (UPF0208 family)
MPLANTFGIWSIQGDFQLLVFDKNEVVSVVPVGVKFMLFVSSFSLTIIIIISNYGLLQTACHLF